MELIEERRRILLDTPHIETISTGAFKTDMVAPFKKLEARFEAEQSGSGDPSPDNVRSIEGRTDMVVRHIGKNLFDKGNPLVKNKYVSVDGSIQISSSYQYSDYYTIVQPNTNYIFSGKIVTGSTYNTISFYDNSKNFIGRHVPPRGGTGAAFTTPVDCCYIRFNIGLDAELDTIQLEVGSEATEYESYTEPYYPLGKNLADPSSIIKGGYYSGSGAWSANTVSATTGLIRVKPNTTYVSSIFDNAGTRLNACVATLWNDATTCTGQITTQKFTTGSQTQYVRIRNFDAQGSYITNDDFKFQLEEGETPTAFEEYKGIGYIANWGKNLLDVENIFIDTRNYVVNEDKSITILQSNGNAWTSNLVPSVSLNAGTYTFSRTNPVGATIIRSSTDNYASDIVRLSAGDYSKTFTLTGDAIIKFKVNTGSTATFPNTTFIQIELGSEASEYQPYVGEVYGGTIDLINGTLTVDRVKETFVFDNPTEDSTYNLESQRFTLAQRSTGASIATNKITNVCGNYAYAQASWQEGEPHFYIGTTACIIYLTKNAYRGGDIEVCYPLAEPYIIQLTPQQILTLKNNNTLMPEGSINELKYWTHI